MPIEKAYPALETEYKRLELDKKLDTEARNAAFAQLIIIWGRGGAHNQTADKQASKVILQPILGRGGSDNRTDNKLDFLSILSDPEYMAGVKEKLNLIAALAWYTVATLWSCTYLFKLILIYASRKTNLAY